MGKYGKGKKEERKEIIEIEIFNLKIYYSCHKTKNSLVIISWERVVLCITNQSHVVKLKLFLYVFDMIIISRIIS